MSAMLQPFTAFEDELRSFESGIKASALFTNAPAGSHPDGKPNEFEANGTLQAGAEAYVVNLTGQAAWDTWFNSARTAQDMRNLQYHSMNSLGYIGYQFGEPLMQDIGYYTADGTGAYDWQTAHFTGLDGATSLATFETPIEEAAILREFGVNIHYIEYYLAHPNESGITFSQQALPLDQYVGQTFTADNGISVTITVTGILAAAHLTGWNGVIDLLVNHHVHVDQNNTPSTQYMNDYGGYDSSFFGADAQTQIANLLGLWNNGNPSNELNVAETLYQEDFNGNGTIGDGTGQGIGGGEPGGLGGNGGGGGGGDQTFIGTSANQTFAGTATGNDTVDYSANATAGITVDLNKTTPQMPGGNMGTDTLTSIENLVGSGFGDHLYGNSDVNKLNGNGGDDFLDGRGGADIMTGGAGNDTYYVDNIGDQIVEGAGDASDKAYIKANNYVLAANTQVEYLYVNVATGLTITGNDLYSHHIYGGAGVDHLNGGSGADSLNGEGGADVMAGGNGNDSYTVDNLGDQVVEGASGGMDKVYVNVNNYVLGANAQVEYLYVNSTAGLTVTGNDLYSHHIYGSTGADHLNGGANADILDGKGGADTMAGGGGNDSYYVDNAGDTVVEGSNGGTDKVYVETASYTLSSTAQVEYIYADDGNAGVSITSNDFATHLIGAAGADHLNGGSAADQLDGKAGADVMAGGGGNDTYYIDNVGDTITEGAGGGTDKAYVAPNINFVLNADAQVEYLYANGGASGATVVGNDFSNHIYAGAGTAGDQLTGGHNSDVIVGGAGSDVINGGGGRDFLTGGGGNDLFVFSSVANSPAVSGQYDTIEDFTQGHDKIDLSTIDANTTVNGDQAFNFIGSAAFSQAGDLRAVVNANGTTTVTGDTNGDHHADFEFTLATAVTLNSNDFFHL